MVFFLSSVLFLCISSFYPPFVFSLLFDQQGQGVLSHMLVFTYFLYTFFYYHLISWCALCTLILILILLASCLRIAYFSMSLAIVCAAVSSEYQTVFNIYIINCQIKFHYKLRRQKQWNTKEMANLLANRHHEIISPIPLDTSFTEFLVYFARENGDKSVSEMYLPQMHCFLISIF